MSKDHYTVHLEIKKVSREEVRKGMVTENTRVVDDIMSLTIRGETLDEVSMKVIRTLNMYRGDDVKSVAEHMSEALRVERPGGIVPAIPAGTDRFA